jgi:TonB family protein
MFIKLPRLFTILIVLATSVAHAQTELKNVAASALPCVYGASPSLSPSAIASLPPSGLFATVRAVIDPQGHVQDARLEIASGNTAFDSAALQQSRVAKCHPFVDADGNRAAVQTTFAFQIMPGTAHNGAADTPTPSFALAIQQRIRARMSWDGASGQRDVVIALHCTPDGHILSATIIRSSGDPAWDAKALEAVRRSDPLPQDANGKTPTMFKVTIRVPSA